MSFRPKARSPQNPPWTTTGTRASAKLPKLCSQTHSFFEAAKEALEEAVLFRRKGCDDSVAAGAREEQTQAKSTAILTQGTCQPKFSRSKSQHCREELWRRGRDLNPHVLSRRLAIAVRVSFARTTPIHGLIPGVPLQVLVGL